MYLTKTESKQNRNCFYRMDIVQGLFGDWGLIRGWGRIGSSARVRTDWFETLSDAKDARFVIHMQKAKRGYE